MGKILWHLSQSLIEPMRSVADESERFNFNGKEVQLVSKESNSLQAVTANISMWKLGEGMITPSGHFIPKETTVFLPQHVPNRDPQT